jgi:4-carboxymuconolactone decarboxylase
MTRSLVRLSASLTTAEADRLAAMDEAAAQAPAEAEEVLVQSYLFLGYPAALNALGLWRRRTGRPAPEVSDGAWEGWAARGETVCREVYGDQYPALREVMAGIHPDLDHWAVVEGYGKVLGRPGLDLRTRELCIVGLLAGIEARRQLHAHLRGCLNVGVSPARVGAALDAVAPLIGPERTTVARQVWARVRDRWVMKGGEEHVRR